MCVEVLSVLTKSRKSERIYRGAAAPGWQWDRVRRAVLIRNGFACRHCGVTEWLRVNQVVPRAADKSDEPEILKFSAKNTTPPKHKGSGESTDDGGRPRPRIGVDGTPLSG